MQAKLLRVLESGEVVRLGSNEPRKADVRFVSATNKDLQEASARGTFRQDLYFRIKGAHIHIPPLRERREDIPRIARHAVNKFAQQYGGAIAAHPPELTDAAMMRLTAYAWPGNVRQLLNVVQNMVVMAVGEGPGADGVIRLDLRHVPAEVASPDAPEDGHGASPDAGAPVAGSLAGTSLEQIEKRAIRETLRLTAGNREKAAELLGIGERTLYRKLKEYGLR
jgi:two-component system response regulator HydG